MYFKRIEITGFKSFAEKTGLEFEPGVTAIVGPNGCGKSNVSDAIRWVLGEQSAKSMRGSSMEDVIFNGTSTREAVNFAEVSLTLSNEAKILPVEYDEVVISRRLYRSGESEYLLNKNPIRLKDILDLLAGTGLGVTNYSVIEQGKIDMLISGKPETRRELFDEAAGITRYKTRKREALRKLELTEQNLVRAADIISEVKRQITSIERQAKKAEVYKRDFEKLKKFELNMSRKERSEIGAKCSGMLLSLEESNQRRGASEADLQEANRALKETREAWEELERAFSDSKTRLALLESELKSLAEKKELYADRIRENREREAQLGREILDADMRIARLELETAGLTGRHEALELESETGQAELQKVESGYQALEEALKNAAAAIAALKLELVDLASKRAHAQNEITKIESRTQNLTSRENRLRIEKEKVSAEWNDVKAAYDALAGERERLTRNLRQKIEERESTEREFEKVEGALKTTTEQAREISREHSSLESRLQVLQDMASRHEGFSQGVRTVLSEARTNELLGRGVIGALADLVEVDRGYELALEIALQNYAQGLVCVTAQDALMAAKLLREGRKGHATFLCAQAPRQTEKKYQDFGFSEAHPLLGFARPNSRIAKLFESLVQGIFVVPELDDAVRLAERFTDVSFVTARGEFCRGDVIVAGSLDAAEESLLFGREARINESKGKLVELGLEKDRLQRREEELAAEEKTLSERLKEYGVELPKLQVQLADVESRYNHLEAQKQRLDREIGIADTELEETAGEILEARSQDNALKESLSAIQDAQRSADEILKNNQLLIEEQSAVKENMLVEMTRMRSAYDSIVDRLERALKDLERSRENLGRENESRTLKTAESGGLGQKNLDLEHEIASFEKLLMEGAVRQVSARRETEELEEKRASLNLELERIEERKTGCEEALIRIQNEHHELQLEQNRLEHELQRIREKILASYQVDLDEFPDEEPLTDEEKDLFDSHEVERLRERLAKMGTVNLVAIEEFDELKKRYEFLTKEQTDLLSAKDDIHKAILKINRQTREMFADAFTKIQSTFVEYFKLLFNGGNAELILLDENDVLESGIEIVARPPGKKLQNITLLSGGEKALTAIALLFAVLKVKPSPFVILDEIDAPLDELNVQRFTSVLGEFVKGSQFIIITHNKRTMALADVMYGVTMQESGMSRVVSVKFAENAESSLADNSRKVTV